MINQIFTNSTLPLFAFPSGVKVSVTGTYSPNPFIESLSSLMPKLTKVFLTASALFSDKVLLNSSSTSLSV